MLLMAGDKFDFKKTTTAFLRHYEGEGLMIGIRNILKSFGVLICVVRGNHEKEEVLRFVNNWRIYLIKRTEVLTKNVLLLKEVTARD